MPDSSENPGYGEKGIQKKLPFNCRNDILAVLK